MRCSRSSTDERATRTVRFLPSLPPKWSLVPHSSAWLQCLLYLRWRQLNSTHLRAGNSLQPWVSPMRFPAERKLPIDENRNSANSAASRLLRRSKLLPKFSELQAILHLREQHTAADGLPWWLPLGQQESEVQQIQYRYLRPKLQRTNILLQHTPRKRENQRMKTD